MAQKKRRGSGRVTPKGTRPDEATGQARKRDLPDMPNRPPHELRGKAGKQSHKVARPITHNRGNR